jgi:PKD repeat protein
MASIQKLAAFAVLTVAVAACTTKKTEPPPMSGPSGFGTALALSASPSVLPQDGHSTSQIVVQAYDGNNQPIRNLSLRADIWVNGTITDFGQLSQKSLSTGSDGRATVTYTAPAAVDNVDRQTLVSIAVTPTSGDARGDTPRSVDIRLVPTGTVGGETPVPNFTVSPASPVQLQNVTFDASDPTLDSQIIAYDWNFGDGDRGTGRVASHQYREVGSYTATLTVTDSAGRKGSRSRSVSVGSSGLPTASFVFSPTSPGVGEEIGFNASSSAAVAPRTIVRYDWEFGTGRTGSGMVVFKRYDTPGTYNVTLTVTDDAGNKSTNSQSVTVGTASPGGMSANFNYSPTSPTAGTSVAFDASISTSPGTNITRYEWDFGDAAQAPRPRVTTNPRTTYTFPSAGTYRVTLRIVDSQNRTATRTQDIAVAAP